jgi:uncharacterized protein YbaR (Trm112 family)
MVSQELLDILACPACKEAVVLDGETLVCVNGECRRRYRIEDDIPIMLIDESEELSSEDWSQTAAAGKKNQ